MENSKEPEKKKVSEKDLNTVNGGNDDPHYDPKYATDMLCRECYFEKTWLGNYKDGIDYECPKCHKIAFRGIRLYHVS